MNRLVGRAVLMALFIAGFVLFVVGVLYLITPVEALPAFLGGIQREGLQADAYRTKRADVALIVGVLFLIASGWLFARSAARSEPQNIPLEYSGDVSGRPGPRNGLATKSSRRFSVRCSTRNKPQSAPTRHGDTPGSSNAASERLRTRLMAGGLEEVEVRPEAPGDALTIRGSVTAENKEAARAYVRDQIYAATPDLTILDPGVWVDEYVA